MSNPVLPNHLLKLVPAEVRATWGKAGMTAEEAEASFVAKNEAQLQTLIQTMLQRNGVYVVRQRTDKRSTVKIGCPDMLFAVNGQPIAWEIKMPGGKPRPEQEKAMQDMQANGWHCSVIRSYDEALAAYNTFARVHSPLRPNCAGECGVAR